MTSMDGVIADQVKIISHIKRLSTTLNAKPKEDTTKGYVQTVLQGLEENCKIRSAKTAKNWFTYLYWRLSWMDFL